MSIPDEAATKATFDYTWAEMVQEEPVLVELWRDQLRTALNYSEHGGPK